MSAAAGGGGGQGMGGLGGGLGGGGEGRKGDMEEEECLEKKVYYRVISGEDSPCSFCSDCPPPR